MGELILVVKRGEVEPLARLAMALPGVRVIEERRVRTRDRRITKRMMDHGKRSGKDRRRAVTGAFALVG